jgi:hypothetical protein
MGFSNQKSIEPTTRLEQNISSISSLLFLGYNY